MTYLVFKFYRAVDRVWDSVSVLRRLRDSAAFKPVTIALNLFWIVLTLLVTGYLFRSDFFPEWVELPLAALTPPIIFLPFFFFTVGARLTAVCSASHPGSSRDNLTMCAGLLQDQGFTVRTLTQNSIYAKRGSFYNYTLPNRSGKNTKLRYS